MSRKLITLSALALLVALLATCDQKKTSPALRYLNHNDTVDYVGMETCRSCHGEIYNSFIHTGMGSSFAPADTTKSLLKNNELLSVYDAHSAFHYHPFWFRDSLYLRESRLQGTDTIFQLQQKVDYVIGSGQHTNSHIFAVNGYAFQLPFTWYAQKGLLDLPPGFEAGNNQRFSRIIGLECLSCHNAMPTGFVMGSENKFRNIPNGINCERCHGPGEAHIQKISRGDLTDTSRAIDYSIVNPSKLNVNLQFELCQRCHLQGNAVLAEGKSFFDFKPGMELRSVMDVYLPRFENSGDQFIMASHADRFKMSKCFQQSEGYTCTSCHNPHVSVLKTKTVKFNNQCRSCHENPPRHQCSAPLADLEHSDFNCVSCHMPASGSVDIPHVTVHDHFVRKEMQMTKKEELGEFLGLVSVNNPNPGNRSKALAYLQQYERFEGKPLYLDSALFFLNKLDVKDHPGLWVQYYFLRNNTSAIAQLIRKNGISAGDFQKVSYSNEHAWTNYRIGESLSAEQNYSKALEFYQQAVRLAPYVPDFRNKLGTAYLKLDRMKEAREEFLHIVKELPIHKEALNNLGYTYLLEGKFELALKYINRALARDPDYVLAWLNKANIYLQTGRKDELKKSLREVLRLEPNHPVAVELLKNLNS